jgi:hypothetical protein
MTDGDRLLAALAPIIDAGRYERLRRESKSYRQSLELLRAVRLSPTLEVCESILRNPRKVPVSRLDRYWAKSYGLVP